MMKRLIALLLACLLLVGCTPAPIEETTLPSQTQETTLPMVEPTEPSGTYDPDSKIEADTNGAVRAYPLGIADVYAFSCMGDDIVIFSGIEKTKMTRLSGENLFVTASLEVDTFLSPDMGGISISDKGIVYYDGESCELVMLNSELQKYSTVAMPEDMIGIPIISDDRRFAYYCTENEVRELTIETGISRVLKEVSYPDQSVEKLLLNGSVLCCNLWDEDYRFTTIFLSVENGQVLWEGESDFYVSGKKDNWYATTNEGTMTGFVYGDADGNERMLIPSDYSASGFFVDDANLLVVESYAQDYSFVTLECYDLSNGKRISSVSIEEEYVGNFVAGSDSRVLYMLSDNFRDADHVLYRWDIDALPTGDDTDYSCEYFNKNNPDEDGLSQCREEAERIGELYGVKIHIGDDATRTQPWDYDMTAEYQVPVVQEALATLEQLLSVFPEGMLADAAWSTADGYIHICIVRTLTGSAETGSLDSADGIHFFDGDNSYIALAVGSLMDQTFYHEMFHALETRLLSASSALYDWEYLNPEDFTYDYDYVQNQTREDFQYLDDENRYFIDMYSMSFPKEDRARVFEYSMIEFGESFFTSEPMQAKLLAICKAIRKAYDLKKYEQTLPWEQYLNESLAYTK